MRLAQVFKVSIYALTAFVGFALGVAENGPIPFVSLPVTIFAYWWCEIGATQGPFRRGGMGEIPARVLSFLALVAASIEFFGESQEGKLLAGIHLVVYLTWVVLLQEKTNYRYWLLMTLGMMHVAVGSVLTSGTWYGLCMVLYLFAAIWTLSVFSLYRLAQEFQGLDGTAPAAVSDVPSDVRGQAFNSVRFENNAQWISFRLISGVAATSMAGLFVGILFFALIPRVWVGSALGISDESLPPAMRRSITGQASEIRLGDLGPILESNDPVLTIRIFDEQTNRPIGVQAYSEWLGLREPLFRGSILTEYAEGHWRPERAWSTNVARLPPLPGDQSVKVVKPTVREEIRLHRIGTDVLYCVGRPVAMRDPEGYRVGLIQPTTIVVRRDWFKNVPGAVDYLAYCELPSLEARDDPGLIATSNEGVMYRVSNYMQRCLAVPAEVGRVRDLAMKLIDDERVRVGRPLNDVEMTRVLESYLRDSGEFAYSLDAHVADFGVDPVEDFLFNRRAGHCQYFASALALMIRSVGIPARIVTGFKGGEALADGTLNVEKRYSHVWVEAWIDHRKWMTFDATPEDGRAESVFAIGAKRNLWTTMTSRLAGIWESNVLDISYERQDDVFYQPLRDLLKAAMAFAREFWTSPQTSLATIVRLVIDPRNWMTVPGATLLAVLILLLHIVRRKAPFRFWRRKRQVDSVDSRQCIEFYERFVRLMKAHGRVRDPSQTQGEFVAEMNDFLLGYTDASLDNGLQPISKLFYYVRFGGGTLTMRESAEVENLLSRLERDLETVNRKQLLPA